MSRYHRHHAKKRTTLIVPKTKHMLLVDKLTLAAAVLEPVVTLPQATVIFKDHNAAGVSLSTWIGYEILTLIWVWYGWVHKERMILIYQGLFMVVQATVIIGGLMYGATW